MDDDDEGGKKRTVRKKLLEIVGKGGLVVFRQTSNKNCFGTMRHP